MLMLALWWGWWARYNEPNLMIAAVSRTRPVYCPRVRATCGACSCGHGAGLALASVHSCSAGPLTHLRSS